MVFTYAGGERVVELEALLAGRRSDAVVGSVHVLALSVRGTAVDFLCALVHV